MTVRHTTMRSPVGELTLVAEGGALVGVYFADQQRRPAPDSFGERVEDGFAEVADQLQEYFAGRRQAFELTLAPRGKEFERRVWASVAAIPYGQTRTYGELAAELGNPTWAQAVGAANGRNPLCVLVPCHRVVGADGGLVGYAGGLWRKRFLLGLEEPAAAEAGRLF